MGAITFGGYDVVPSGVTYVLTNNGHTIQVNVPVELMSISGGGLNGRYKLVQFHAHWGGTNDVGCEHTFDGKSCPLELHFVHFSDRFGSISDALDDPQGVAVIGVFAQMGEKNSGLENIVIPMPRVQYKDSAVNDLSPFKLVDMLPSSTSDFVRYNGSLTTPNCQESVIWTLLRNPITVSQGQLNAFRELSKGFKNETFASLRNNYRPVQDVGSRTVLKTYNDGAELEKSIGGGRGSGGAGQQRLHGEAVFCWALLSLGLQLQSSLH